VEDVPYQVEEEASYPFLVLPLLYLVQLDLGEVAILMERSKQLFPLAKLFQGHLQLQLPLRYV
jgi:hypothetical protein